MNGSEETLTTKFDCNRVKGVSYNEAEHGRFVVSKFHDLDHLGTVPRVEVGNVFRSRTLPSMIGSHGPLQAGICYLKPAETDHMVPVATSIFLQVTKIMWTTQV